MYEYEVYMYTYQKRLSAGKAKGEESGGDQLK